MRQHVLNLWVWLVAVFSVVMFDSFCFGSTSIVPDLGLDCRDHRDPKGGKDGFYIFSGFEGSETEISGGFQPKEVSTYGSSDLKRCTGLLEGC